jgi:KRAB domain-containing zinc finger protein
MDDYSRQILKSLYQFQQDGYLCDTVLVADDGQAIKAHGVVLAAASPIFKAVLETQSNPADNTFLLKGVQSRIMDVALHFMYTGDFVNPAGECVTLDNDETPKLIEVFREFGLSLPEVLEWQHASPLSSECTDVAGVTRTNTEDHEVVSEDRNDHLQVESCESYGTQPSQNDPETNAKSVVGQLENSVNVTGDNSTDDNCPSSTYLPAKKCCATRNSQRSKRPNETTTEPHGDVNCERVLLCEQSDGTVGRMRSNTAVHVQKEFVCSVCSEQFSVLRNLIQHRLQHTGGTDICGDVLSTASCKTWGRYGRGGPRGHVDGLCELCGKNFKNIAAHMRVHSGEQPHICDVCGQRFSMPQNLVRHRKRHTGERPYLCQTCGRGFIQRTSLVEHTAVHHPETFGTDPCHAPFSCRLCGERFFRPVDLKHHMMLMHDRSKANGTASFRPRGPYRARGTSAIPLVCHFCDRSFSSKQAMENHERTHTGEKPFRCDKCGNVFRQITHLRNHIRTHTGERPFACSLCKKTYRNRIDLRTHCSRVHQLQLPMRKKLNLMCSPHWRHRDDSVSTSVVLLAEDSTKDIVSSHTLTSTTTSPTQLLSSSAGHSTAGNL